MVYFLTNFLPKGAVACMELDAITLSREAACIAIPAKGQQAGK